MDFLGLDPLLQQALREDVGRGDVTTRAILKDRHSVRARAEVRAKEPLLLAGWPVFVRVFQLLGAVEQTQEAREGEFLQPGVIGCLEADAALLLQGERVALNLLQRMCGIASKTHRLVELVSGRAQLLDTRKTTPLWRSLEKYAVRLGGGRNHRMGLDDAILIKENHIAMAGGIAKAIQACRENASHLLRIEVEVTNFEELEQALESGADVIMLDNFSPPDVKRAVKLARGACRLEASGGITEENLTRYAETGVDFISMGSLTHSFRSADISMIVRAQG